MISKLDQIERLANELSVDERRLLLERLNRSVNEDQTPAAPTNLYGAWRGRFPKSFDVESALREIRGQWQQGDAA